MKSFFLNFRMAALLAAMLGLFACVELPDTPDNPQPDPDPDVVPTDTTYLDASVSSTGVDYVEISLKTAGLDSLAYVRYDAPNGSLTPVVMFRNGKRIKANAEETIRIEGLSSSKQYFFYFAGKKGTEY